MPLNRLVLGFLFSMVVACPLLGQAPRLEMPGIAAPLPTKEFKVSNGISKTQQAKLPKTLPIFRYSGKPVDFSTNGLQELINRTVFKGTNIADLLRGHTNIASLDAPIRLAAENRLDSFFVDGSRGSIAVRSGSDGSDLRKEIPPSDAVPSFEDVQKQLLSLAATFGVNTNEMAKKENGAIDFRKSDGKKTMRGGAVKFMSQRSVRVLRSVGGYFFLDSDDKIEISLGVNGWLQKLEMTWRPVQPVRTNSLFSLEQIVAYVKSGQALADISNEYPDDGVVEIKLKDIQFEYYAPKQARKGPGGYKPISSDVDIFPVAVLYVEFKSSSGKTTEGVLFLPASS